MQIIWEYLGSVNSGIMGGLLAAPVVALVAYSSKMERPLLLKFINKPLSMQDINWDIRFNVLFMSSFFTMLFFPTFALHGLYIWVVDPLINRESLVFVGLGPAALIIPMFGISLYFSFHLCRCRGLKKGGIQYKQYAVRKAIQYKIDPIKMNNRLLRPIYLLSLLGFILASMTHISIDSNKLTYLPFLSFIKYEYDLKDTTELIIYSKSTAPNGDITNNSSLVIKFKTSPLFNTDETWLYMTDQQMMKLVKLAEEYSGIKLRKINTVNPY